MSIRQLSHSVGANPHYVRGVVDEAGIAPVITLKGHYLSPEEAELVRRKIADHMKRRASEHAA